MAKEKISPMLKQYLDLKEKYQDTLLFFRLGDFYEMFFEDALTASKALDLTLTGRNCGLSERAPMCGVPYHAIDQYTHRLLEMGYKVAVCEQLTEPGEGKMLERDVVRIVTPGTVIETSILDERANNYLMAVYLEGDLIGLASADVSTGEFSVTELPKTAQNELVDELVRLNPREILVNAAAKNFFSAVEPLKKSWLPMASLYFQQENPLNSEYIEKLEGFEPVREHPCALQAACGVYDYLLLTQKNSLMQINELRWYEVANFMLIDSAARKSLELTETMRAKNRRGSLLWVLDKAQTAMGSRLLRRWLEAPLQDEKEINARLDAVEYLKNQPILRDDLITLMKQIRDMERLTAKISYTTLNARDCQALGESCAVIPGLKKAFMTGDSVLLKRIHAELDELKDISSLLNRAIAEDPPLSLKEGGIIKKGYNEELDNLRHAFSSTREVIAQMELTEREATGIKNLKIGYNRVFGYYIEVTNSFSDLVPYRYVRKQTLANAERYITSELKELEDTVLHAEERSMKLEYQLFCEIREVLTGAFIRLQQTARAVAQLDVLCALAQCAHDYQYVRPEITTDGTIQIIDGRHPVVERGLSGESFVPNNTVLDDTSNRFLIITGPNMAGKSTYLRQVALIVIMAHMGGFVPARQAKISLTDRVYTRVGAGDDLFMGQSTFMVEMSEVSSILKGATKRSLVVLDEIGRGTSTFDGLSIAWAVVEYISDVHKLGCKALFATHYHELTELEDKIPGVKNYYITAKEVGDDVIFLRKVIRGGADKSFGIQVARLAGLPESIIKRSKEILKHLEDADINNAMLAANLKKTEKLMAGNAVASAQLSMVDVLPYSSVLEEIRSLDINALTPMDAMFLLNKLKSKM